MKPTKPSPKKALLKGIISGVVTEQAVRQEHWQPDLSVLTLDELDLLSSYLRHQEGDPDSFPCNFKEIHHRQLQVIDKKLQSGGPPAPSPNESMLSRDEQRVLSNCRRYLIAHRWVSPRASEPTDEEWRQWIEDIQPKIYRQ